MPATAEGDSAHDDRRSTNDTPRIRLARTEDLEPIVELAVEFFDFLRQREPTADEFRPYLAQLLRDPNTDFLVAEVGARCVGYIQVRYRLSAWHLGVEAELEDVFVTAAGRGTGVGRALLGVALDRVRERGATSVGVQTNERNESAQALYRSFGFVAARPRWEGGRQIWYERRP